MLYQSGRWWTRKKNKDVYSYVWNVKTKCARVMWSLSEDIQILCVQHGNIQARHMDVGREVFILFIGNTVY
jgi:hypothetical protein